VNKKERFAVENCGQNSGFCGVHKKHTDDEFKTRAGRISGSFGLEAVAIISSIQCTAARFGARPQ
jgi:hypothetical protein